MYVILTLRWLMLHLIANKNFHLHNHDLCNIVIVSKEYQRQLSMTSVSRDVHKKNNFYSI